jgi:hypothetical protein
MKTKIEYQIQTSVKYLQDSRPIKLVASSQTVYKQ